MRLAILKYMYVNYAPEDIPSEWPAEVREIGDEEEAPGENWVIMTLEEFENHKNTYKNDYLAWEETYRTSQRESIELIINKATAFGHKLLTDFVVDNVMLGITQSGKTVVVTNYLHKLEHYIRTGSLYAAVEEIDRLIAAGLDNTLEPFVTEDRLNSYKLEIKEYLGI